MSIPTPPWRQDRRTKQQPTRAPHVPLSQQRIVDAALEILAAEGLAAVTMRRVAAALDTGAASLYAHVQSKDELHELMLDQAAAETDVPEPDPQHWQDQIKQVVRDMTNGMRTRPGLANVAVGRIPTGPNALRVSDRMLAILLAGGLDEQTAAFAVDLLPLYATAVAMESGSPTLPQDEGAISKFISQLRTFFASLPAEDYPHMVALAVPLTAGAGHERFEFGLEVLISGLAARVRHTP